MAARVKAAFLGALAIASGTGTIASPVQFDLNDYAVGLSIATQEHPYRGAHSSLSLYPYLTSLEDSTLTADTLVVRDGGIGLRRVMDSGFEWGVLARVETQGFGSNPDVELAAYDAPAWALEVGPSIGWRGWRVQPDLTLFKGVLGGHSGLTGQISVSVPFDLARGYFVPYAAAVHRNQDFVAYYYDLKNVQSPGDTPNFTADAATNFRVGARFGYRLSPLWLLTADARIEILDDVITDSVLVEEGQLLRASVGLAYNRSLFRNKNRDSLSLADKSAFEISLIAVRATVESDLSVASFGEPAGPAIALENALGLEDTATLLRADAFFRLGQRHRIELGYTALDRSASVILGRDLIVGSLDLSAGDSAVVRYATKAFRLAYGYSFLRDDQKEVGVLLGVHWPSLDATVSSIDSMIAETAALGAPVPMFGVYARAALRGGFTARARLETANAEVDRYRGRLLDFVASADWKPTSTMSLSLGYTIHHIRLRSPGGSFVGSSRQTYSGPFLGLRWAF